MTDHHGSTTSPTSSGDAPAGLTAAKKALIAVGIGMASIVTAFVVVQAADSSPADEPSTAVESPGPADAAVSADPDATGQTDVDVVAEPEPASPDTQAQVGTAGEPSATDTPDAPATDVAPPTAEPVDGTGPVVTEPVDTGEPTGDVPPVPTIVVGVDENGNDIVVELEISRACATTFHTPLDDNSLSFIRWVYDAPGLEPGTAVEFTTPTGFSHFTKVNDERQLIADQGISSYGDYPFPTAEWQEGNDTTTSIEPDGNHTVDDREGDASLTCLS